MDRAFVLTLAFVGMGFLQTAWNSGPVALGAEPGGVKDESATGPSAHPPTNALIVYRPCHVEVLAQGSETLRMLSDRASFAKFARLRQQGLIDPEMDFFTVTEAEARNFGVDYYELQQARTVLHDYVHGVLIDLVTSRIARAVGSAVARKSAGDTDFSRQAAVAFFLALQYPTSFSKAGLHAQPTIEYADALLKERLSKNLFFMGQSMQSLARTIIESDYEPVDIERFLEIELKFMLLIVKSWMGPETDEARIALYFDGRSGAEWHVRQKPGANDRETLFVWNEALTLPGADLVVERTMRYERYTRARVDRPRLVVPVFNMPVDETRKFSSLVTAEVFQESHRLGQILTLDSLTGQQLNQFVESLLRFRL